MPLNFVQGLGGDVLGQIVEGTGNRVVGIRYLGPVAGEDLVGFAAQQKAARLGEPFDDVLETFVVGIGGGLSPVFESAVGVLFGPARRLHHAVQRDHG